MSVSKYLQKNGVHAFKSSACVKNGVFKALLSDPSFNSELVEALGDEDKEDAELEDMDLDVLAAVPDDVPVAVVDAPYAVAKAAASGKGSRPSWRSSWWLCCGSGTVATWTASCRHARHFGSDEVRLCLS